MSKSCFKKGEKESHLNENAVQVPCFGFAPNFRCCWEDSKQESYLEEFREGHRILEPELLILGAKQYADVVLRKYRNDINALATHWRELISKAFRQANRTTRL